MKEKIGVYFSGYNQNEKSKKYEIFKKRFHNIKTIKIDFTTNLSDIYTKIEELNNSYDMYMLGSSIGCLLGLYSYFKFDRPLTLINPSFFPEITLHNVLSKEEKETIKYLQDDIIHLQKDNTPTKSLILFLAKNDERINFDDFLHLFENKVRYINWTETGGHSFDIFEEKIEQIVTALFRDELELGDFEEQCP